jgi:hypothetical protein
VGLLPFAAQADEWTKGPRLLSMNGYK